MSDRPFLLLTQGACPGCERLKKMLAGPLRGQFDSHIEVIHRQSAQERFDALSVPALIRVSDGTRAHDPGSLGAVRAFLQG